VFDPALSRDASGTDTARVRAQALDPPKDSGRPGFWERSELQPAPTGGGQQEASKGLTMNISPLDLRQQRFRSAFNGFDKVEVASLLAAVADDYEHALREADRLRQDLTRMEAALAEHREHERNLRNTLLTAQRLADEIREHAEQEAKRLVREAEGRADLLIEKAQGRLDDIQRDIDNLKLRRRDVEASLESIIQTLRGSLEYVRDRDGRDAEEKILLHRPRQASDAGNEDLDRDAPERRVAQGG
jgi:cell division initiation protein